MDEHVIHIYFLYRNRLVVMLRILVVFVLALVVLVDMTLGYSPGIPLFFFNILIMFEVFYRYRLCTLQTRETVSSKTDNPLHVMTLEAQAVLYQAHSSRILLYRLFSYPQNRFFIERVPLLASEIEPHELDRATLTAFALKVTGEVGGKRITTMDILAAYLLLTEEKSKLLFSKKLKESDLFHILRWSRMMFPFEDTKRQLHFFVHGGGVGEFLTTGWTLETKKYTRHFTNEVEINDVSIIGREREYEVLLESLTKIENNNVLLIGDVGVGKEQLVKRFALDSYSGRLTGNLQHQTVLELMVGPLLAGANSQGELQSRLQSIIDEISHAQNVILYIPEFQNLLGAGTFSLDLSGVLMSALKSGRIPIIASISEGNNKAFFEASPLKELFTPILLAEPDAKLSELMVMEKTREIETKGRCIITYKALQAAVHLADRYAANLRLPGSAISVLSDALSRVPQENVYDRSKRVLLTEDLVLKTVETQTHIVLHEPSPAEREVLLHLEEILHEYVIGQHEAIRTIAEAMRRLRSGLDSHERPVSFLFLGPTGVGKTETARALAKVYFGGEKAVIRLDMSEYANESDQLRLLGALPGQGDERGELTEQVRDHPNALILLDEFEKAHPSIISLFLQIFEDGRLTDNRGRTVSFVNSIIIATSNAGSEMIHQAVEQDLVLDQNFERRLLEHLQEKNIFKPELLNRFDDIVTFTPLTQSEVTGVTKILLQELQKKIEDKDITIDFSPEVLHKIATEAYDKEFGARPLRRYIQDKIEDLISSALLSQQINRGDMIRLTILSNGEFGIVRKNQDTLS